MPTSKLTRLLGISKSNVIKRVHFFCGCNIPFDGGAKFPLLPSHGQPGPGFSFSKLSINSVLTIDNCDTIKKESIDSRVQ